MNPDKGHCPKNHPAQQSFFHGRHDNNAVHGRYCRGALAPRCSASCRPSSRRRKWWHSRESERRGNRGRTAAPSAAECGGGVRRAAAGRSCRREAGEGQAPPRRTATPPPSDGQVAAPPSRRRFNAMAGGDRWDRRDPCAPPHPRWARADREPGEASESPRHWDGQKGGATTSVTPLYRHCVREGVAAPPLSRCAEARAGRGPLRLFHVAARSQIARGGRRAA